MLCRVPLLRIPAGRNALDTIYYNPIELRVPGRYRGRRAGGVTANQYRHRGHQGRCAYLISAIKHLIRQRMQTSCGGPGALCVPGSARQKIYNDRHKYGRLHGDYDGERCVYLVLAGTTLRLSYRSSFAESESTMLVVARR